MTLAEQVGQWLETVLSVELTPEQRELLARMYGAGGYVPLTLAK